MMDNDDKPDREKESTSYPPLADDAADRRRVVGQLIGGAGVVGAVRYWAEPVVQAVLLPAHAQTTAGDQPASPPSPSTPPSPPTPPTPAIPAPPE